MQAMCLQDNILNALNGQKGVMKMTKVNSVGKRLGAAVMACAMAMAMAVGAGALDANKTYEPDLEAVIPVPHTLEFFEGNAEVTDGADVDTVTIELKDPASVTVNGTTVEGVITRATCSTPGYTAEIVDNNLVVTCDANVDAEDFGAVITFDIERMDGVPHGSMPAKLVLSEVAK